MDMDNVIKSNFLIVKKRLNLDIANLQFYKKIKSAFNKTILISIPLWFSFLTSVILLGGMVGLVSNIFITIFFFPFFSPILKLFLRRSKLQPVISSIQLPSFITSFAVVKSAEDIHFFSRDKVADALQEKPTQLVFLNFFNVVKNSISKPADKKVFENNLIFFKTYLELNNTVRAADYFIELYLMSYNYESVLYDESDHAYENRLSMTTQAILEDYLVKKDSEPLKYVNLGKPKFKAITAQIYAQNDLNSSGANQVENYDNSGYGGNSGNGNNSNDFNNGLNGNGSINFKKPDLNELEKQALKSRSLYIDGNSSGLESKINYSNTNLNPKPKVKEKINWKAMLDTKQSSDVKKD